MSLLQNPYISGVISLFIALYAVLIAPGLPNKVLAFFDTIFGRLFFLFLVAYVASEGNVQVSVMIAVALAITLMVIGEHKIKESFRNSFYEHFSAEEPGIKMPVNARVQSGNTKDQITHKKIRGSNFETHMNLEDYAPVHFTSAGTAYTSPSTHSSSQEYESNQELQSKHHTTYPEYF